MPTIQAPPPPAAPARPDSPALLVPRDHADPLVVLLARAAQGDEAAGRAFAAGRAARLRMNDRLTEQSRRTAHRMLRPFGSS
ncbi:hypothetical protein ACFC58_06120 [Kitasatospora purpeofusca]|uniref:hypothetical protein n=1 Tax=Kitasatospora purpeofusca TaxID=67352 RepID=UPI0035D6C2F3